TAVAGTRDGSVWFGTNSGEVVRLRGGTLQTFGLPAGVGRDAILSLSEAADGGLWVVADNGRVFHFRDGHAEEHTPDPSGVSGNKVRLVIEDGQGPIFFVRGLGPARLEHGRLAPLIEKGPRAATSTHFHAALRDASGTLWVGTTYGLLKI